MQPVTAVISPQSAESGADVELREIVKSFGGDAPAVAGLSLAIAPGELVSFLGPSGCGKTTTLRIIAGFVDPDSGLCVDEATRTSPICPPNKRDIGMLFQSYALFPHLTAADNVAFGLRMRHIPRQRTAATRGRGARSRPAYGNSRTAIPHQMSGGQQQRVALARAIVIHPRVLLLDEPLSNLDAKLRRDMRTEIRQLQRQARHHDDLRHA